MKIERSEKKRAGGREIEIGEGRGVLNGLKAEILTRCE